MSQHLSVACCSLVARMTHILSPSRSFVSAKPGMKLVVEQVRRGMSGAVAFSGKLSALYSSGLAEERGWSESGWKRGRRRARRVWQCEKGFGRQEGSSKDNRLLLGTLGCKAVFLRVRQAAAKALIVTNRFHAAGLRIAWAQRRAALGRDPCNLGEQNGQRGGSLSRAAGMRSGPRPSRKRTLSNAL
jgi:hypothetical protein